MTCPVCAKPIRNRIADCCLNCGWTNYPTAANPADMSSKAQDNDDKSPSAPLLSLDAYKLRKKLVLDTTRVQMELIVSNLLDDIRADRVEGLVLAVDMKDGQPRVEAGGQMTCASALWLGQMIINKVGPN